MCLILCSRGGGGGEGSVTMHYVCTVCLVLCSRGGMGGGGGGGV